MILGLSNRDSAALAGISESAFYEWIQRGEAELERLAKNPRARPRENERPFVEFAEAVKRAVPTRKRALVSTIRLASHRQWQAAAWLLERLHPGEFGQKVGHMHAGPDGGPIATVGLRAEDLSDEELARIIAAATGRGG